MKSRLSVLLILASAQAALSVPSAGQERFILPGGLEGQCLHINLDSVKKGKPGKTGENASYTPLVVSFPNNQGNAFTVAPQGKSTAPVFVSYSPFTNGDPGAMVELESGEDVYLAQLQFEPKLVNNSYSGTVVVTKRTDGKSLRLSGGSFTIRPAQQGDEALVLPVEKISHPAPVSLAGRLVVLNFYAAEESRVERGEQPETWKALASSPMAFQFPVDCNNTYSYQLYESSPESPWPPVKVTYDPAEGCIHVTGNDMHVRVLLSFHAASKGAASIEWHDEGGSWYVRNADFAVSPSTSSAGLINMPQAEETEGAIQTVDDGLGELVRELENRKYPTAVERLYQKRLLTLLPQIMEGASIDTTILRQKRTSRKQ